MRILLSSFDHKILDKLVVNFTESLILNGYQVRGPVMMPVKQKKWTILSSPFVHKNARHQLELKSFKRLIDIEGKNALKALHQLMSELHLPYGIEILIKNA